MKNPSLWFRASSRTVTSRSGAFCIFNRFSDHDRSLKFVMFEKAVLGTAHLECRVNYLDTWNGLLRSGSSSHRSTLFNDLPATS